MLMAFMLWGALFAEDAPKGPPEQPPIWSTFLPLILIFVVFYFLLIRPAQKRERNMREQISAGLKKNVEVVTSGGIIGTVTHIKENGEEVTIRIDDNAKMRILRSSIARILTPAEGEKPAEKTAEKPS
jgi:preprotein translocase subunit YajC